ncbi:MAG: hypothetical protein JWN21_2411 [Sphingomonas bacterium]|nr:hypothetical protein [Sphingomonas bacterium]
MHALASASLGAVLRTALDAVVVMRVDGTVAGWNDVAERTFGWSFAEARGRRVSELIIAPQYRAAHDRGLEHFLATGHGPALDKHLELTAVHCDGRELPVELSVTRTEQFGEPVFLGFLRDISDRRDAARQQELMIGELNHRVKNLLGVVSGIAHQTARTSPTLVAFEEAFRGRLASLARAHEVLTAATWQRAPLGSLVRELVEPHLQASVSGPDVLLSPRQLLSVSMILHELTANAIKYGALSRPEGRVTLVWAVADGQVAMEWVESGLDGVRAPTHRGFGSKMIAISVGHELRGTTSTDWRPDGLTFHLTFAVEAEE